MWHALPNDVARTVLWTVMERRARSATSVQAAWRRYRTRVLVGRYGLLMHLREFRAWNPTVREFLARSRL